MRLIDKDELLHELKRRSDVAAEARMTLIAEDFIDLVNDADVVEVPRWIPVTERMPDKEEFVLVVVNGRWRNIKFVNAAQIAMYDEDGWWIEAYPEWKNPMVSHWMLMPEPPEVE